MFAQHFSEESQQLQHLERAMAVIESFHSGSRTAATSGAPEGPTWTQYEGPWSDDVLAGICECRRGFEPVTWVEAVPPQLAQACNKAQLLAEELHSRGRLSNLRKLQVDARVQAVWNPVEKFAFFGPNYDHVELTVRLDFLAAGTLDLETLKRTYRYVATGNIAGSGPKGARLFV